MATEESGLEHTSRYRDFEQIRRGRQIYLQHCATCHGIKGEGAENWRQRDSQGFFPPPPLNGSGHSWHHPMSELRSTILNGSPISKGRMPAWKDILSEDDVEEVIRWFQFLWPEQAYAAWLRIERDAVSRGSKQ